MTGSILVYVGLDLMGDALIKLPFLRALRHAWPSARITWMAGKGPSVFADLLAPAVSGLIDEVIEDARVGRAWREVVAPRPLAGRRFDLVIDTQRRVKTTLCLTRIRHGRFVSASANWMFSDCRPARRARPESMAGQLLQLVEAASGRAPVADVPLAVEPELERRAAALIPDPARAVGLAPGAGGRHKCWPLERFLAVGRHLADSGRQPVILLGPAEAEWFAQVRRDLPEACLPLQEGGDGSPLLTIAIGRRLAAAVANDSGTGHMLAAAGTPLVSLFGPTPAAKFAPTTPRLAVLTAQAFGGGAMEAIPTAAVIAAVEELLAGG